MPGFGEDFLKGFFGSDYLKDYTHASKTFRSNGYELAPRFKYLFYVKFNLNSSIPNAREFAREDMGLVVKNVELPGFAMDVSVVNQYNRKRLVQSQIEYNPIQIVFHDDTSDLIRQMLYSYMSYYYKDMTHAYGNLPSTNGTSGPLDGNSDKVDYASRDTYSEATQFPDWGYIGESYSDNTGAAPGGGKPRFFNDITIYGFSQQTFAQYTLINPLIQSINHDTYDYAESNGTMEHRIRVLYETVKYYSGSLNEFQTPSTLAGGAFDPNHYDTVKSPLVRPGANTSILGPGGVLDAIGTVGGAISDLQNGKGSVKGVLGAVQAAGRAYESVRDKNLKSVIQSEANSVLKDVIRNQGPNATKQAMNAADGFFFGQAPSNSDITIAEKNTVKKDPAEPATPTTIQSQSPNGTWT